MPPGSSTGILQNSAIATAIVVIPARYSSTRLPGKPLADVGGRPLIEHVYRRALAARTPTRVLVATDDERIVAAVEAFGGRAVLTRSTHRSGTERLAEVAENLDCDLVVNLQGDEPLIDPALIDQTIAAVAADPHLPMATLRRRIEDPADFADPHVVKVVTDVSGNALYFSRLPIPSTGLPGAPRAISAAYKHIGLYAYRRDFLITLAGLTPTALELSESLEQLRALEHGYRIRVLETTLDSIGVDTPEDLERVRRVVAVGAQV